MKKILLTIACLFLLPSAWARSICWIDKIESTSNKMGEVDIFISIIPEAKISIAVFPVDKRQFFFADKGKIARRGGIEMADGALRLHDGDVVGLSQGPEDNCSIKVIANGSRQGVEATASLHLQGSPPQEVTNFVQAVARPSGE